MPLASVWAESVTDQVGTKCRTLPIEQNSMQFNINWLGKPNYEDVVFSMFNGNQCDSIRYSFLHQ